jgi:dTDP-glucose 4,6-dehydratase
MSDYALPMNIGNPDEITMNYFAEEILKLVQNPKAFIDYRPLPEDDPKQRKPDITKARSILGWEPKVHRAEGLSRTFEYFKAVVKV